MAMTWRRARRRLTTRHLEGEAKARDERREAKGMRLGSLCVLGAELLDQRRDVVANADGI